MNLVSKFRTYLMLNGIRRNLIPNRDYNLNRRRWVSCILHRERRFLWRGVWVISFKILEKRTLWWTVYLPFTNEWWVMSNEFTSIREENLISLFKYISEDKIFGDRLPYSLLITHCENRQSWIVSTFLRALKLFVFDLKLRAGLWLSHYSLLTTHPVSGVIIQE